MITIKTLLKGCFGCGAALLLTATALAQQEQWLEYHTGGSHGYKWIELTNAAPPNVALPKLQSGSYFGRWTNGLDGGRWLCLDRTRSSGPCDRIFVDCNGNGRLDDETPFVAKRRDQMWAYFDGIKVIFKGEDGPISYHLGVRFYKYGERAQLMLSSAGWYEGRVNVAGKKCRLQLIDQNVNGAFNDRSENYWDSDQMVIGGDKDAEKNTFYLGRYLEVDGQLCRVEAARDGAFVKLQKADGIEFGSVRVPESIVDFQAIGENGHFVRKPEHGEFKLPVGTYRVHHWAVERTDDKGTKWKLSGSSSGAGADFRVNAGATTVLNIGEPIRAALTASESKTQIQFSLKLLGSLGETVEIYRGTERPRPPEIHIASANGPFRGTNKFEYG